MGLCRGTKSRRRAHRSAAGSDQPAGADSWSIAISPTETERLPRELIARLGESVQLVKDLAAVAVLIGSCLVRVQYGSQTGWEAGPIGVNVVQGKKSGIARPASDSHPA